MSRFVSTGTIISTLLIVNSCAGGESTESRSSHSGSSTETSKSEILSEPSDVASAWNQSSEQGFSQSTPSRFAKLSPKLSNPIKVVISQDGGKFPGKDGKFGKVNSFTQDAGFTLVRFNSKEETWAPVVIGVGTHTFFPFDRDVEVTIKTPMTITKEIEIYGGRNVVVKGEGNGVINKVVDPKMPAFCDKSTAECKNMLDAYRPAASGVLRLDSQRQSVVIENLKINVNGDFTDAIVFRQNPNTFKPQQEFDDFKGIDIFVRNIGAYGIGGAGDGQHGDIVQLQNGVYRNMFFENIDGATGYQGFYLPNRPKGHPTLCRTVSRSPATGEIGTFQRCMSPIIVKGMAFLQNIVLRTIDPKICPHCPNPYRGLYTVDDDVIDEVTKKVIYKQPRYTTELQNVTFFRDPRSDKRNIPALYVMPQPPGTTPEGTINMTKATTTEERPEAPIKGLLNILSTNYYQAKNALLKSGWKANAADGTNSFPRSPEVSCKEKETSKCKASFSLGTNTLTFEIDASGDGSDAELLIVGAHY